MTIASTRHATPPTPSVETRRVLVVIDETCTPSSVCSTLLARAGSERVEAFVVAPAHGPATSQWLVDEDADRADADRRLRTCLGCLGDQGIATSGGLGDPDPVHAIADALHAFPAERILIITAPQRPSTWLHENAIDRARHTFTQPVEHVVVPAAPD